MTIKEIRQHKNNTIRQQIFTYLIHVRKEIFSIDTRFFTVSKRLPSSSPPFLIFIINTSFYNNYLSKIFFLTNGIEHDIVALSITKKSS